MLAGLNGALYADLNGNGQREATDRWNVGWQVYLDLNNNSQLDATEPSTRTDYNGRYTFSNLATGTYTIRQVLQPGWERTQPAVVDSYTVFLGPNEIRTFFFGNRPAAGAATVLGILFSDNNANGAWDAGDTRCEDWVVYLDQNNNSLADAGEPQTRTDSNGLFVISGLDAGTYRVRQVLKPGWRMTSPASSDFQIVTLAAGQTAEIGFGNTQANSSISGAASADPTLEARNPTPLANWAVYVDSNNNGLNDLGERWTTTNESGQFSFTGLPAGEYRVRLLDRDGWTPTAGADGALVIVNGTSAVTGVNFGSRQDPEPVRYDRDKIVAWMNIGGSSANQADRQVGWNIKTAGWSGFVNVHVQPQLQWGARRMLLHNPFGSITGEVVQNDQYLEATAAGLTWLTTGFVEAWRPITQSGVEVIAYIGSPANDASFVGLSNAAYAARFWASVQPLVDAGMSIGFDMSLAAVPGSIEFAMIDAVKASGVPIYGEPRPPESSLYWRTTGLIAEDQIWRETDPERNPEVMYWAAKDPQITGDVVRGLTAPPAGQSFQNLRPWMPALSRSIMREGHSVGIPVTELIRQNISIAEIAGGRMGPRPTPDPQPPVTTFLIS